MQEWPAGAQAAAACQGSLLPPGAPVAPGPAAMPPAGVALALGPLLLLPLLPPTSAFFPNIWSLLAAPGSVTHQDLTEAAALNATLQLFLERPPPGRAPLRLEDFLVRVPGSCHLPAAPPLRPAAQHPQPGSRHRVRGPAPASPRAAPSSPMTSSPPTSDPGPLPGGSEQP